MTYEGEGVLHKEQTGFIDYATVSKVCLNCKHCFIGIGYFCEYQGIDLKADDVDKKGCNFFIERFS